MQRKIKWILDILMIVCLITFMLNQFTGIFVHEILGIIMFICFFLHHFLNRNFYKTMGKGTFNKRRRIFFLTDILLLILMILMVISSLLISQHVFTFLNITNHTLGRYLHIFSAYTLYILSAFHLGLHYSMMIRRLKDKKIIVNVFFLLFALFFGIYGFIKKEFFSKLTLQNLYPLYSEDNVFIAFIDYFGIFLFFMMIGYGCYLFITRKKGGCKNEKK